MRPGADDVAKLLDLAPLPHEGGRWAQSWIDERSSAIYFLLSPGDFSALHRLPAVEVYHFYAGDPAELTLLHADGTWEVRVLGNDLLAGQRPVAVVPTGTWQGSSTLGEWSLLGTTMSPPFTFEALEMADAGHLSGIYPPASEAIERLTR